MNKRKNIYDQLAPICDVERKHDGFLLHFKDGTKERVPNATKARLVALTWARMTITRQPDQLMQRLIDELADMVEENDRGALA